MGFCWSTISQTDSSGRKATHHFPGRVDAQRAPAKVSEHTSWEEDWIVTLEKCLGKKNETIIGVKGSLGALVKSSN